MARAPYNVLFLSAGNSVRSIFAECLATRHGGQRFRCYSAGCHPRGELDPIALEVLREHGHDTSELRSKSWDEFKREDAPTFDFAFTICDLEGGEACPTWWGELTGHWGIQDLDSFTGSPEERRRVFQRVYAELEARIKLFTALRQRDLEPLRLRSKLYQIDPSESETLEQT